MNHKKPIILPSCILLLFTSLCFALIMTDGVGRWPQSWPEELESLRKQSKTIQVAHGIKETVFEIPFNSQEQFEKAWPYILEVKSKGAPLIIEKSPSTYKVSGSKMGTGVRILCPSGGSCGLPGGVQLQASPPWPESAKLPHNQLSEYVIASQETWIPFVVEDEHKGFRYRARVDIVLVMDGDVIDLNRIPLPADTPIIDRRFE